MMSTRVFRSITAASAAVAILAISGSAGASPIPIKKVEVKERKVSTVLAIPTKTETRSDLPNGTKKVISAGKAGSETCIFSQLIIDGKVFTERLISRSTIQPTPKVVQMGASAVASRPGANSGASRSGSRSMRTAVMTLSKAGSSYTQQLASLGFRSEMAPLSPIQQVYATACNWDLNGGKVINVEATAYTPDAGLKNPTFMTATGRRARRGMIAVDPRVVPMNSLLYVEGYGWGVAADTGGAIKGKRIDVCVEGSAEARNWGRRGVKMIVFPKKHTQDLQG